MHKGILHPFFPPSFSVIIHLPLFPPKIICCFSTAHCAVLVLKTFYNTERE